MKTIEAEGANLLIGTPGERICRVYAHKKNPLQERRCSENASDVIPMVRKHLHAATMYLLQCIQIRAAAMKDQAVWLKGKKAFCFLNYFVKARKEHHCFNILRWQELEIGKLAMGYGLFLMRVSHPSKALLLTT
ncbi:PREDICTED: DEAD-box ATP-dependent RNA helicase 18-like [Camelina sativa]|uniref:DEAD-box ATP-dependent RNA helicase 18-like n=1 Tax=Camelina sativa TaxID=90675 RepID=A0ABM0TL28_CAMSA|nr:PREDICTED: DEAD-box ATP-dependent RNA helicase 18-like [Camelina sativa]